MIIDKEFLFIASTADNILVCLSLTFAYAAVSVTYLNVEQHLYPGLRALWRDVWRFIDHRWRRRRWVYYAFGGTRDRSQMNRHLQGTTARRPLSGNE